MIRVWPYWLLLVGMWAYYLLDTGPDVTWAGRFGWTGLMVLLLAVLHRENYKRAKAVRP